eukprot:Unigene3588_Nuclearia_a/m.10971 Unigene3588_Nuclearia_a/g.10971  ORF Unigene3588_Nuclearia_a/g.10971 Unigene3588_Nuclearia_a/m.10971 type:complete len:772 (-) Unigene3588_Nuclearia_a:86-2401(-)
MSSPPPAPLSPRTSADGRGTSPPPVLLQPQPPQPVKKTNRLSAVVDMIITRPRRNSNTTAFISLLSAQKSADRSPSGSAASSAAGTPTGRPVSLAVEALSPVSPPPVFGSNLPTDSSRLVNGVPLVVFRCVQCLLKRGLEVEGVFRVPASQVELRSIRAVYDRGEDPNLDAVVRTPHVAPALLKMYLRELPEPLLTYEYYDMFISAAGIGDVPERLRRIRKIIEQLPEINFNTLYYIVSCLRTVAAKSDKNKMDAVNLSVVIVPNILRANLSLTEEAKDAPLAKTLLVHLIQDFDKIFDGLSGPLATLESSPSLAPTPIDVQVTPSSPAEAPDIDDTLNSLSLIEAETPTVSTAPPLPEPANDNTSDTTVSPASTPTALSPASSRTGTSKKSKPRLPTLETSGGESASKPVDIKVKKVKQKEAVAERTLAVSPTTTTAPVTAKAAMRRKRDVHQAPIQRSMSEVAMNAEKRHFVPTVLGEEFLQNVMDGDLELVRQKIKEGLINVSCTDRRGWNALMFAVAKNDFVMIRELIAAGCDINAQNERGETALYKAAASGSIESAQCLIDAGADVHKRDDEGRSPIIIAAFAGERTMCALLLKRGADLNDRDRLTDKTPLIFATYARHEDTVELLLQRGADVNAADAFGWTALMLAAHVGDEKIVRILVRYRATIGLMTKKGKTAATIAIDSGHHGVAEYLSYAPTVTRNRNRKASDTGAEHTVPTTFFTQLDPPKSTTDANGARIVEVTSKLAPRVSSPRTNIVSDATPPPTGA